MAERITIMLDTEIVKQVRIKQADLIKKHSKNFSFSKVLGMVIEKGLKDE